MPHSRNGAGTRAVNKTVKIQAITSLPKKRTPKRKPTPYQKETLFGRKSPTDRLIEAPFVPPRSQRKSLAMGLKRTLKCVDAPVYRTTEGISSLLFLGTNASTSPITIRTKSKKASPHHRSKYSVAKSPFLSNRQSERLRNKFKALSDSLGVIKDPLVKPNFDLNAEESISTTKKVRRERKSSEKEDCISLYKQHDMLQEKAIDLPAEISAHSITEKITLSPEEVHKAKNIPIVENGVKIYTRRVWLEDIIDAEEKARTQSRKVFGGLSAQQLAICEETNVDDTCYEYLHLLAHSFGGEFSRENIVIGSRDANTIMTLYDHAAKYFLEEKMCNYVDIRIECTLKSKKDGRGFTHHAKEIKLSYKTDDGFIFYSPLIDGDSIERPTVQMGKEINALLKEHYLAYKASLAKTEKETAIQEATSLWPQLPAADPMPQQKSILNYFPLESKEETSDDQQSSRKRKQSDLSTKDNFQQPLKKRKSNVPLTKITRFFPIENNHTQEKSLLNLQSPIEEPIAKCTHTHSILPIDSTLTPVLPYSEPKPAPSSVKKEMTASQENIFSNCSSAKEPRKSPSIQSTSTFFQPKQESKMPGYNLDTELKSSILPLPSAHVF